MSSYTVASAVLRIVRDRIAQINAGRDINSRSEARALLISFRETIDDALGALDQCERHKEEWGSWIGGNMSRTGQRMLRSVQQARAYVSGEKKDGFAVRVRPSADIASLLRIVRERMIQINAKADINSMPEARALLISYRDTIDDALGELNKVEQRHKEDEWAPK